MLQKLETAVKLCRVCPRGMLSLTGAARMNIYNLHIRGSDKASSHHQIRTITSVRAFRLNPAARIIGRGDESRVVILREPCPLNRRIDMKRFRSEMAATLHWEYNKRPLSGDIPRLILLNFVLVRIRTRKIFDALQETQSASL